MSNLGQPEGARISSDAVQRVRDYHQRTKHMPGRYAPAPWELDWANQPDPFRRFAGTSVLNLPLITDDATPPYDQLFHSGEAGQTLTPESLGLFLELSLGLTAWKEIQGTRWALRSNPSSGNLHPTEGYVVVPSLRRPFNNPGVYHYAPREHGLEQRCVLSEAAWNALAEGWSEGTFLAGFTSVHWREAWKYGERSYRYCQHDVGHALGALFFAAAALGWRVVILSNLSDAQVAGLLGLDRATDFNGAEAENPEVIAAVVTEPAAALPRTIGKDALAGVRAGVWAGTANQLSPASVKWDAIATVVEATVKPSTASVPLPALAKTGPIPPREFIGGPSAAAIIRQRRSAVAMDGRTGLQSQAFFRMLQRTLPYQPHPPWTAIDFPARILLSLFVHRIEGLPPGHYVLVRDETRLETFRSACNDQFAWVHVIESGLPLYALALGDCREAATNASCFQAIAGDSAFSLGMVADFGRTLDEDGPWAYRRLFWEAGLIGQVLYLEAEAAGVRSTGMGCYFDDQVHQLLGLSDHSWQSLYHFTVGGAVDDVRLATHSAYAHLSRSNPS